ncbi:hypothetical protein [Blastococcus sp. PRF04-17]|uniref:hypothetical protein n=1 Tax=Blastococcus sp. PRF04-17 TaxID=2933797 RepID=UPI001FF53187|nr:hypothetical protein [Blastococcus sp. PRF04-17]UOY01338.1 hypothetical protein MVA48_20715 [Blastococcus sp. PRF04-17]
MPVPTADAFAALARSSPWRWSTLRFTVRRARQPDRAEPLRAWLRRPDLLRVETLHGALVQIVREPPTTVAVLGFPPTAGTQLTYRWPVEGPAPVLRADGLVDLRPPDLSYDAPMFQDYRWVAMLDPVELADGQDPDTGEPGPPLVVDSVSELEHAGRAAWEAVVRTTAFYEPRCGCCPLLRCRDVDVYEYRDHPQHVLAAYPDAYRVRLDVGTGVCVFTEEIGGLTPGEGHDLRIEAVDEPMDDDLFVEPPRGPFRPRFGWSPLPGGQ